MPTLLVPDPILCFGPSISITVKDSGVLFCLPKEILTIAPNMAGMFTLPPHKEGSSDDHPIELTLPSRATLDDFRAFIFFLLPSLTSDVTWDVAAWTGVLRIANWAMLDSARDAAIHHLHPVVCTWPPTQLYRFAQEHRVIEWHIHAIKELLCRPEGLNAHEVGGLGFDMAVQIMDVRLRAERVATVRVFNQMIVNVRGRIQEVHTREGDTVTIDQIKGLLDGVQDLMLGYRSALPGVVSSLGQRWATVIDGGFIMRHFPVDYI